MNYYKQGDAANADKIKAAFEKLGYNTGNLGFTSSQLYFTIEGKVELICTKALQNLIKTHPDYKELELPVKPKFKFKVGDWIVRNNGSSIVPIQVYDLKKDRYLVTNTLDTKGEVMLTRQDEWHLWNTEDATDGDVLVTENYIFIFKYILHGGVHLYCHYDIDDEEFDSDIPDAVIGNIHDKGAHFRPATQQQRNLFFKKMQEAGYQWYAGKKELKKIQVEPKFKVGDWIVGNEGIFKITQYEEEYGYYLTDTTGRVVHFVSPDYVESNFHLWTIDDAKDGDMLTDGKLIVIFNKFEEPSYKQHIIAHIGLDLCGRLQITEDTWQLGVDKAMPAAKEQHDLLFQKMKEAGYEWDADKKELKKIQPHYDISNFKPFDKVLCRGHNRQAWRPSLYGFYDTTGRYPMFVCATANYLQCIPFDGNEHLLGTTDMCDEMYINW